MRWIFGVALLGGSVAFGVGVDLSAQPVTLTGTAGVPNGAWCWYQDPRAIVDTRRPDGPLLLTSSVSFGAPGSGENGDVDLSWYDPRTRQKGTFELHDELQGDDHDVAALMIRPDGRYLAVYTKHGSDRSMRYRISTRPHDPTAWSPEKTFQTRAAACYSNLHAASGKPGHVYDFLRSVGWHPNYLVSTDAGETWRYGGKLLTGPGGDRKRNERPYVRYASDGKGTIHFVVTDGHPRNYDNSIYHGIIREGKLHRSDGTAIGPLSTKGSSPYTTCDFTPVMASGTAFGGEAMRHAWTIDLQIDAAGRPRAVFIARANDDDGDHRFFYARFDDRRWRVFEIASAGGYLYKAENDYTGLAALHPHDDGVLFISTDVDPRSRQKLAHYEIFRGVTADGGAHWTWAPVTWQSRVDNLRPIVPAWDRSNTALLWLQGECTSYTKWNARVVALFAKSDDLSSWDHPGQKTVSTQARTPDEPKRWNATIARDAVKIVGDAVCDRQFAKAWRHREWQGDWVLAAQYVGQVRWAETTKNDVHFDRLEKICDSLEWKIAVRERHADDWCIGDVYGSLYERKQDPHRIAHMKRVFAKVMKLPYDESLEFTGGITLREWAWCDALFMGPQPLVHLANVTGDDRYRAFANRLWWKTTGYLYDPEEHLYFRDSRYFERRERNGKKIFWARGNGWVFAGLARMLEYLPKQYPDRPRYETLYREMAAALLRIQRDDGFWATGLLDPGTWDNEETSGTAFFTFGLAWGINRGLLDRAAYLPAVEKGWRALVGSVQSDGKLIHVQPIGQDPYGFDPMSTMPYGVGGFLLAASELFKLAAE